jgi:hypothetical protein
MSGSNNNSQNNLSEEQWILFSTSHLQSGLLLFERLISMDPQSGFGKVFFSLDEVPQNITFWTRSGNKLLKISSSAVEVNGMCQKNIFLRAFF